MRAFFQYTLCWAISGWCQDLCWKSVKLKTSLVPLVYHYVTLWRQRTSHLHLCRFCHLYCAFMSINGSYRPNINSTSEKLIFIIILNTANNKNNILFILLNRKQKWVRLFATDSTCVNPSCLITQSSKWMILSLIQTNLTASVCPPGLPASCLFGPGFPGADCDRRYQVLSATH